MRVTNGMQKQSFLRDLSKNQNNLKQLNQQLTSGKEISRPSDNPFKVSRSMQLSRDISANKQYDTNIKDTINALETTDTALEQVGNSIQRIRELMVSSGNASYGSDEKRAIRDEVNEKIHEVAQILNTNFDGKYVLGGTKTASKPVTVGTDPLTGNNQLNLLGSNGDKLDINSLDQEVINQVNMIKGKLTTEISQGVVMDYNVTATDVLMIKDAKGKEINVMELLTNITNNISSNNATDLNKVSGENLLDLDATMGNLLKLRAEVGAKQNRMDSAKAQNEEASFNMKDILSQTEDIDFAEKMIQVSTLQSVYMASLQTSARIQQNTLLNFIK